MQKLKLAAMTKPKTKKPEIDTSPSVWNPNWKYTSAADSSRDDYLRRKFAKIRREQAEAKTKQVLGRVK